MGIRRELKAALESLWKGELAFDLFEERCRELRLRHWTIQKDAGLSMVTTGDFAWYDHVLDTAYMFNAIPERFRALPKENGELYFKMARGDERFNTPAMEMTKWFNTNYHYITPEIDKDFVPQLNAEKILKETKEALDAGFVVKPVVVGPITFLSLAKGVDGYNCWEKAAVLVDSYAQLLAELAQYAEWIQIDEPILAGELPEEGRKIFVETYQKLNAAAGNAKLLLATYFDSVDDNLDLALQSGCAALHLDLTRGGKNLDEVLEKFPQNMILSAGIVDGRNIWKNNFAASVATLRKIQAKLGDRMMVASSCSLLHSPVDLSEETLMDPEIKNWMAFAVQKCSEVAFLSDYLDGTCDWRIAAENAVAMQERAQSSRIHRPEVKERLASVTSDMLSRKSPYPVRRKAQESLNLPLFPTTTIGSFPQTPEIRRTRRALRKNEISQEEYVEFMKKEIAFVVQKQEELGLDVLVHGEPERNDMVEYFGEQLNGFVFTQNGWVQSYGSRCVKPPVIYGDVSRPAPMTIDWICYAQSLTKKPMKGMLTGPVTILCWSFVRDDVDRETVCKQIALAIRDETADLEKNGVRVIQIDEAALSEGMPIKKRDAAAYLKWAVESFRLTSTPVEDETQIHTHMCYSEFNKIIRAIAEMDADVISIEACRSKMELLEAFREFEYPNEIGPGVYDIHSPRIPETEEIVDLLERSLQYEPAERLWVNPDCGLKTRRWEEVLPSLEHMVAAAKIMREK